MLPAALKGLRQSARDRTYLLTLAVIAIAYVGAARFGQSFGRVSPHWSALWPASGIALAAMLLKGYRVWPGVFLGTVIASASVGDNWWVCLAAGGLDSVTAGLGTFLLQRAFRFRQVFTRPYDVLGFVIAAIVGSLFAGLLAPLILISADYASWHGYHSLALRWFESLLMGDLVFAPVVLVYFAPGQLARFAHRYLEAGFIMATLFASSLIVMTTTAPIRFLLFPLMVWVAIRFTQVGVVTGITIVTAVALWATANHLGPFASYYPNGADFIVLQLYLTVLSGTSLVVAMAISELRASGEELKRNQEQLESLDAQLREANKRIMHILGGLLDDKTDRRSHHRHENNDL